MGGIEAVPEAVRADAHGRGGRLDARELLDPRAQSEPAAGAVLEDEEGSGPAIVARGRLSIARGACRLREREHVREPVREPGDAGLRAFIAVRADVDVHERG